MLGQFDGPWLPCAPSYPPAQPHMTASTHHTLRWPGIQTAAIVRSLPGHCRTMQVGAAGAAGGAAGQLACLVQGHRPGGPPAARRLQRALQPHPHVRPRLQGRLPLRQALPRLHRALLAGLHPPAGRLPQALQRALCHVRAALRVGLRASGLLPAALRRALHQVRLTGAPDPLWLAGFVPSVPRRHQCLGAISA
jgi:hypothetical protein